MPEHGPLTITVPGAVSGWAALVGLGASSGSPGVRVGRRGRARRRRRALPSPRASHRAGPPVRRPRHARGFRAGRHAALGGPDAPATGTGSTLKTFAEHGPAALYGGEVGARLVEGLRAHGSPMTLKDLASHGPELDPPLAARYRDLHVSVVPPNSQGFALLEMLLAAERLEIDPDPLGAEAALLAEVFAAASATATGTTRIPGPHGSPWGHCSTRVTSRRCATRSARGPVEVARRPHGDTIALVSADGDGRAVSLIQSLYDGFGSGILEPATGIVGHNRGSAFSLDPGSPNVLAGGKRPAHTLMPVMVHREGRLAAVAGSMGGGGQPQINFQNLVRLFDLGMDPEATLAAPRWTVWGHRGDGFVRVEGTVPEAASSRLAEAGFRIHLLDDVDEAVGHAHMILPRPDGTLEVGSDPRADGGALAL